MNKTTARQIAKTYLAPHSLTSEQVGYAYAILARSENVDDQNTAKLMINAAKTAGTPLTWIRLEW